MKEDTKAVSKAKEKSTKRGKKLSTADGLHFSKNYDRLEKNIFIVFVECESSGNVGFLARTMANFGLKNLVLINPCELKKEAYYQAMHARPIVEDAVARRTYPNLDEFFKKQNIDFIIGSTGTPGGSYNLSRIPIKPQELGESINLNQKIAILFGREGNGLYNEEIDLCDIIVSIPTDHNYPIMNISHAAAIIFYEIFKNRNEFPVEGLEEATNLEKEHLLKDMEKLIKKLNIPEHKEKTGLKSFKNIINRAFITGREAHTLKGILRRILMKFE
ncbi:TrmJ/YjtD family RNA methyltransferase [Methanobrevibacter sp. TMH8]|nr:TrmJ/YjtD family RNA methyltransferase [Methanobrevibacter sp. TMH8]